MNKLIVALVAAACVFVADSSRPNPSEEPSPSPVTSVLSPSPAPVVSNPIPTVNADPEPVSVTPVPSSEAASLNPTPFLPAENTEAFTGQAFESQGYPTQSIFADGFLGGNGESQISSGLSQSLGRGQTFTTMNDGGQAAILGSQQTNVDGSGASSGNTGVSGAADLFNAQGWRTTAKGDGRGGFITGDGRNTVGSSASDLSAFANPLAAGGTFRTESRASSTGATGSFNTFSLGA